MLGRTRALHNILVIIAAAFAASLLLAWLPMPSGAQESSQPVVPITDGEGSGERVAGELVVIFEDEATSAAPTAVAEDADASVKDSIPDLDARLFSFPEIKQRADEARQKRALEQAREELEDDPRVQSVSYNGIVRASFQPNDPGGPLYLQQIGILVMKMQKAWDVTLGEGSKIGVVDGGIQADHPEIIGKVVAQHDFVDDDDIAQDDDGHGTHVAGIAAANTNNNQGIPGICPACKLVISKALNARGYGTEFDVAQGIDYAVQNRVDVVNLSLGGRKDDPVVERAVNRAWDSGVVMVAAAGNRGDNTIEYPAAYPKVISVSSTSQINKPSYFSSRGKTIDLAAPGEGIYSAAPIDTYEFRSGTSQATPQVAGVAGLLASQGLDNDEIRQRLECTARDLGADGRDNFYGHGIVNAYAAVTETCPRQPTPPSARCTISGTNKSDVLRGTPRRDVICGLDGNDAVLGHDGADILKGGPGNDALVGGNGKDTYLGGPGTDACTATNGESRTSCRR